MTNKLPAVRPKHEQMALASKDMFLKTIGEEGEQKFTIEVAFAIQALRGSEYLQKCNPQSITDAVVNVALTGTTLNPALHFAYLVPRDGKCCLDISYRGLAKIATDSKAVLAIESQVVRAGDTFEYEYGLDQKLRHIPSTAAKPQTITHAYMIAHLASGIKILHVMSKAELDKTRATAKTQYVWKAWEEEMCRKTVVKRGYKLLPQTDQMGLAIAAINEHEGINVGKEDEIIEYVSDEQWIEIDMLISQQKKHTVDSVCSSLRISGLDMMQVKNFKNTRNLLNDSIQEEVMT